MSYYKQVLPGFSVKRVTYEIDGQGTYDADGAVYDILMTARKPVLADLAYSVYQDDYKVSRQRFVDLPKHILAIIIGNTYCYDEYGLEEATRIASV